MLYNAEECTLKLNHLEMDYIVFGRGEKPLVMIPGLNTRGVKGSALMLAWMYHIFAKEYRVYVFDRRKDVPEGYAVRDMAEELELAMDALHLKDAHVLGVSQGGMIAQYLAMQRPDLVERMVLAVTLSRNNDTVISVIEKWVKWTLDGDMKKLVYDMAEKMYSEAYVRRYKLLMPLLVKMQTPRDMCRFVRLAKACLTCDAYHELEKITCPTLVIGGAKDKIVTGQASLELAEKLGCQVHMYEDFGHAAYEEAKDFNQIVYDFFHATESSINVNK